MAASQLIDTRGLLKPQSFAGKDQQWTDWAFIFRSYCSLLSPRLRELMENAQVPPVPIGVPLDAVDQSLSRDLFHLLVLVCKGPAMQEVRRAQNAQGDNGFEAWRLLVKRYEPAERNRAFGLLNSVLQHRFDSKDILTSLSEWEERTRSYERSSGEKLPDGVLIATILNGIADPLKTHLQVNSNRFATYAELRVIIEDYFSSKKIWTTIDRKDKTSPAAQGDDMQIGALKGKDGKGPKGKGKGKDGKNSDHSSSGGGGKSEGKGKSKDGKGKGKGKDGKGKRPWLPYDQWIAQTNAMSIGAIAEDYWQQNAYDQSYQPPMYHQQPQQYYMGSSASSTGPSVSQAPTYRPEPQQ